MMIMILKISTAIISLVISLTVIHRTTRMGTSGLRGLGIESLVLSRSVGVW